MFKTLSRPYGADAQADAPMAPRHDASSAFSRIELLSYVVVIGLWLFTVVDAHAFELYKTFQTPEAFLAEVFHGNPPTPSILNIGPNEQSRITPLHGRPFPQSRLRYWRQDGQTAWIFDAIGKEGYVPTTSGFVVKDGVLTHLRVLIYRESRGEQVAEPSFLSQIRGAKSQGSGLDRKVDNISGATLSVQMMERMSRTALELDSLAN